MANVRLAQHLAKARASVTSGELCPPRISAQVVIEPPGKFGVVRRILRIPDKTITAYEIKRNGGGFDPFFQRPEPLVEICRIDRSKRTDGTG